ncbi:hypothetical protein ABEY43_06075 [Priestia megaterium]
MKYLMAMMSTLALVFAVMSFMGSLIIDKVGVGMLYLVISSFFFIGYKDK